MEKNLNNFYKNIVDEVNEFGIAKRHLSEFLDSKSVSLYDEVVGEYNKVLQLPKMQERIERMASGNPIVDRNKWFEITQYEMYGSGINTNHPLVRLYLQQPFIDITSLFYGELPKVRNILMWSHPQNGNQSPIASQNWHRDQEDYKIFKVFINFSDISSENGPTQYCKKTQYGGEFASVYPQPFLDNKSSTSFNPSKHNLDVCDISGPAGTVNFINTNGMHRGGLVSDGNRLLTQCNYLRPSAPLIAQYKKLPSFDYNPKINTLDINSNSYKSLSSDQKYLIS